tara:strand:- start:874 stop:1254 length:381 start_codon:yes stop_codon:yes gene_type:complete
MKPSKSKNDIYSWKVFLKGAGINVVGVIVIKVIQFFVGLAAFTDDVSGMSTLTQIMFWIWSPVALLSGGRDASLGFIPSPLFLLISASTMGVVAAIIYRQKECADDDTHDEPNKTSHPSPDRRESK